MMSMPKSNIWVKTCLLKDAVKTTADEHTKKLVDQYIINRKDNWDWSRAFVTDRTSLNYQEDLILIIVDYESPYEILIPIDVVNKYSLKNGDNTIAMANGFHEQGSVPPDDPDEDNIKSKENITVSGFQLGKTKVFLRQSAFIELTKQRVKSLESAICCIQSQIRRFITKRDFEKRIKQIILIQSCLRMLLSKRQVTRMLVRAKCKEMQELKRQQKLRFEKDLLAFQLLDKVENDSGSETTADLAADSAASEHSDESQEIVCWVRSFKGKASFLNNEGSTYSADATTDNRSGLGVSHHVYGHRDVLWFENNEPRGHGVRTNKAGTKFWRLYDGKKYGVISENAAIKIIESLEARHSKSKK